MSTIVTIQAADLITNSRADINTNFSNLNTDKIETSVLDTDTALTANSDAKVATQKAVKTYVDAGGNVNASETTKGISEEATQAETNDGTATGGTGAKLFVTPAKLAASKYSTIKSVTAGATINGATLPVPVYQNTTDNEYYACDGNVTTALKFQGFAVSNSTDGNSMNIQIGGIVPGFSGLDEGVAYFLSDTVGTIQNTPGTYPVMVGVAISTTELLIQKGRRVATGTATFGTTTTSAVDLGFRPTSVKVFATGGTGDEFSESKGGWSVSGGNDSVFSCMEGSGTGQYGVDNSNAWALRRPSDNAVLEEGTVTTITSTGFTLSNTHGTGAITANLFWVAEGDF